VVLRNCRYLVFEAFSKVELFTHSANCRVNSCRDGVEAIAASWGYCGYSTADGYRLVLFSYQPKFIALNFKGGQWLFCLGQWKP
jgi:hypothetical protein